MSRTTHDPPSFTGIVLAGGNSRRFGEANKAVAVVDGVTFVQRAVEAVRTVAGDSPIVAVQCDEQREVIETGLKSETEPRFAFDTKSFDGPISGLYGALSAVENTWLFLTGCDMPRLAPEAIAWLAVQLRAADSSVDALVPVHSDGEPEPLHGFYRRESVADARCQLPSESSLRELLDALPEPATVSIRSAPSDVPLAASVRNVNTKCEYRSVRRTLERADP